jgi:hypothetical protein
MLALVTITWMFLVSLEFHAPLFVVTVLPCGITTDSVLQINIVCTYMYTHGQKHPCVARLCFSLLKIYHLLGERIILKIKIKLGVGDSHL